jgi:hypothetical protein
MSNKSLIHLISAFVLLAVTLGAYSFWYSIVTAESVKASTLSTEITQQNDAKAKAAAASLEIAQLSGQRATIDQYFVDASNLVPFLEQLQSTGKFLGTDVQVASVSATPGNPYGKIDLSLSVTGNFESVMRTIGTIEYEPYEVTAKSLSITSTMPGGVASSSPEWTATGVFSVGAKTTGSNTNTP